MLNRTRSGTPGFGLNGLDWNVMSCLDPMSPLGLCSKNHVIIFITETLHSTNASPQLQSTAWPHPSKPHFDVKPNAPSLPTAGDPPASVSATNHKNEGTPSPQGRVTGWDRRTLETTRNKGGFHEGAFGKTFKIQQSQILRSWKLRSF